MTKQNRPKLVRLGNLSRTLRIDRQWLLGEVEAGRIPHLRAGHTILFDVAAVRRALAERAAQTPPVHAKEDSQ